MTSREVNVAPLPQLSVAVGVANTGTDGQLIVVAEGSVEITGGAISCTLMICDALDELPQPSVAVQVRFLLYDPAHAPGVVTSAKVKVNELPHASVAVAVAKTGVEGQLIVVGVGSAAITGAVTSCTLMV